MKGLAMSGSAAKCLIQPCPQRGCVTSQAHKPQFCSKCKLGWKDSGEFSGLWSGQNCFQSVSEWKIMNFPLLILLLVSGLANFSLICLSWTLLTWSWMEEDFRLSFYPANSHCFAMKIPGFAVLSSSPISQNQVITWDFTFIPKPTSAARCVAALRRVAGKRQHFPLAGTWCSRTSAGSPDGETRLWGVAVWKSSSKELLFL